MTDELRIGSKLIVIFAPPIGDATPYEWDMRNEAVLNDIDWDAVLDHVRLQLPEDYDTEMRD